MVARQRHKWTPEEYLAFERASDTKHEYYCGEVYDMSGASETHNDIVLATASSLYSQLRKRPCKVYASDMRMKIPDGTLYTCPDIVAVCGDRVFTDDKPDTLVNPALIIEVLSPSTESYDRNEKFDQYSTIPSLQEYILIWQDKVRVEQYVRQPDGKWLRSQIDRLDAILELPSIQCTLVLVDVYEKVEF